MRIKKEKTWITKEDKALSLTLNNILSSDIPFNLKTKLVWLKINSRTEPWLSRPSKRLVFNIMRLIQARRMPLNTKSLEEAYMVLSTLKDPDTIKDKYGLESFFNRLVVDYSFNPEFSDEAKRVAGELIPEVDNLIKRLVERGIPLYVEDDDV